jgi:biofilm PGA synthesis N-glycosyltransferase PgaC
MEILFWFSIIFVFYTYFGYPILLFAIAKFWSNPVNKKIINPGVTMIIVAYNEENNIRNKLENILSINYPKDKLEIIVVSDGSTDRTDNIVQEFFSKGVRLIRMPERGGKARALNFAVPKAGNEIIAFADARQVYEKNAIIELVKNFNDEKVGAVSGELFLINQDGCNVGECVGIYWRYEKFLRKIESRIYSNSGATGAIYAIRKELFRTIPDDTILDDVVIPMNVALSGYRVVFEENANAYDNVAKTLKHENTRKIRTLCGNYQVLFRMPELFNPFKNKVFFQFISHKVFRLLVSFALLFMFISNVFLLSLMFYRIIFGLQVCMYISAIVGYYLSKMKPSFINRLFGVPYIFVMLNYAALVGLYRFITNKQEIAWEKAD